METEEIELDEARKKEILVMEAFVDSGNLFEVLGLAAGATPDQVKKAFYEASRKFHPDRFFGKKLGSFKAKIDRIFRTLSEANQVLGDPAKRAEYLKAHPELARASKPAQPAAPKTPEDEKREAERRARFLKHPYLSKASKVGELIARARDLMSKGDYGKAYTELHTAEQIDAKHTEVKALLLEVKVSHDRQRADQERARAKQEEQAGDLGKAAMAYKAASNFDPKDGESAFKAARLLLRVGGDLKDARVYALRAVEAAPKVANHHALLGEIFLQAGSKALAKNSFEEALKLDPKHEEARRHVKKWWPF